MGILRCFKQLKLSKFGRLAAFHRSKSRYSTPAKLFHLIFSMYASGMMLLWYPQLANSSRGSSHECLRFLGNLRMRYIVFGERSQLSKARSLRAVFVEGDLAERDAGSKHSMVAPWMRSFPSCSMKIIISLAPSNHPSGKG